MDLHDQASVLEVNPQDGPGYGKIDLMNPEHQLPELRPDLVY